MENIDIILCLKNFEKIYNEDKYDFKFDKIKIKNLIYLWEK